MQIFTFYLFASIVIASGAFCIFARNPVHSVLWLTGLMLLLGAEFIAALLIIVYVGAVAVLFLFVVMMLDIDFAELRAGFMKNLPLGLLLAIVLLAEIIFGVGAWSASGMGEANAVVGPEAGGPSNIEALGALLYTKYIFLFEAAGLILLVAMVGAIVLTNRKRGGVRSQNINRQINRRPKDAIRNMQPEVGEGVEL